MALHHSKTRIGNSIMNEGGAAAIEFAFVAPLLVMLLLGLVEVTNMLSQDRKVMLANQTMIDMVSRLDTLTKADRQQLASAISLVMKPYDLNYTATVAYVAFDSDGKPDFSKHSKTFQVAVRGGYLFPQGDLANEAAGLGAGNDAVIIGRITGTYEPILDASFINQDIQLGATNTERPRTKGIVSVVPALP